MKKIFTLQNLKKYRDVLYFIVIISLIYGVWFFASREKAIVISDKNNKALYDSLLKVKIATDGRLYREITGRIYTEGEYRQRIDSISRLLAIKPKFIKGEDSYVVKSEAVFYPKPVAVYFEKDTTYSLAYKDEWVDVNAAFNTHKMEGTVYFLSIDTLTRIETSKTTIFGKTTNKVLISNSNPYNQVKAGYAFTQKQKRTWLSIGPSIQLNPITLKMDYGVSVQLPIIQLKR